MKKFAALAIFVFALTGCGYAPEPGVSQVYIEDVLRDIKRQVTVYYARRATDEEQHYGDNQPAICKKGKVDFEITSVKAELAVTVENIKTGNAGLTLAPTAGLSIGPSFQLSNDLSNAQTLTFTEFPVPSKDRLNGVLTDDASLDHAPIAKTLLALRRAIINARSADAICFTDVQPKAAGSAKKSGDADGASNSFKLAITVVKDEKLGVTVAVLQVLSFGLSNEDKFTKANTLTVTFTQKTPSVFFTVAEAAHRTDVLTTYQLKNDSLFKHLPNSPPNRVK